MKKLILLLFSVLCLVSCLDSKYKVNEYNEGLSGSIYVKEITYKNHSYLEFKDNGIYGQGWVHNPECPCYYYVEECDSI